MRRVVDSQTYFFLRLPSDLRLVNDASKWPVQFAKLAKFFQLAETSLEIIMNMVSGVASLKNSVIKLVFT